MNPLILLPFVSLANAQEGLEPKMLSAIVMDRALSGGTSENKRDAKIYTVDQYSEQNLQYFGWFKIPVFLDAITFVDQGRIGLSEGDRLIYYFRFRVGGRDLKFKFEDEFHNANGIYATCVYTDLSENQCIGVSDFNKYNEDSNLILQTTKLYRNKIGSFFDEFSL